MNLWAADRETRQREGVSPGVKWSHKTFSCPHFYSKTLASNLRARWSGCAMIDWLSADAFTVPKSQKFLLRISLCGVVNVLRHTESNFQRLFQVASECHLVVVVTSVQMLHPEGVCPGAVGSLLDQHG